MSRNDDDGVTRYLITPYLVARSQKVRLDRGEVDVARAQALSGPLETPMPAPARRDREVAKDALRAVREATDILGKATGTLWVEYCAVRDGTDTLWMEYCRAMDRAEAAESIVRQYFLAGDGGAP